jgi:hypothetical protein
LNEQKKKTKELKKYKVIVYYHEPLFCKTIGKDPETIFNSLFTVEADSVDAAFEKAKQEFAEIARASSVHWERKIVKCKLKTSRFKSFFIREK